MFRYCLFVISVVAAKLFHEPRVEDGFSWASPTSIYTTKPFYSIADVHGNYTQMAELLDNIGLTRNGNWIANDTVLVQLGDVVDRGYYPEMALRLLAKLRTQAQQRGGDVVVLMGNHEWMHIHGETKYAAKPLNITEFNFHTMPVQVVVDHPHGSVLFSHAGVRAGHWELDDPEGPLWTRYFAEDADPCEELGVTLEMFRAGTMVVGHTVVPHVQSRCNGKLYLTDTRGTSAMRFAEDVQSFTK